MYPVNLQHTSMFFRTPCAYPHQKKTIATIQRTLGTATTWALKFPTAPFIFPKILVLEMALYCVPSRTLPRQHSSILINTHQPTRHFFPISKTHAKLASSFPRVVGVAGWPWVSASMGLAALPLALAMTSSTSASIEGQTHFANTSFTMRAYAKLLTSSDVHPKCKRQEISLRSGCLAICPAPLSPVIKSLAAKQNTTRHAFGYLPWHEENIPLL